MPFLCSHTAWGNILCKHPPIRSSRSSSCFRLRAMSRLVQQESCGHFFPTEFVQLRAFSWKSGSFLWSCPQNYLFSRKTNVHNSLFCTLIIGRLFLSKEDFALWSHPWEEFMRSINCIASSNIYMVLFLKGIVPQTATLLRTFAKVEVVQFHRDLAEAERTRLPNSGTKRDSKIPKIQGGSVLDVGFSPITSSLPHLTKTSSHVCCGCPKEPWWGHSLLLDFLSSTSTSSGMKREGWEESGTKNQVAEEYSRC